MSNKRLLDTYNKTDNTELEVRFKVNNRSSYQKLISSIKGQTTIEQSINSIAPGHEGNRICQYLFIDGVKKSVTYVKKKSLERGRDVEGLMTYKFVVSSEEDIPAFSSNICTFARIKLRLSIRPNELKNWRVDFTLTKTLNKIDSSLKKHKDEMLTQGLTAENFISNAPWNYADTFELEVEHIGKNEVKESDLVQVVDFIFGLIGSDHKNMFEYQKMIYDIAQYIVSSKERENFKHKKGLRDLYNRVWELNRKEYYDRVFPNIRNFYVLGKADGIRTIIVIEENTMSFLSGDVKTIQLKNSYTGKTICDVEHIESKDQNNYYIFDVLVYMGESLTQTTTENRVSYINKVITMSEGNIKKKTMISLTDNYKQEITQLWEKEQLHDLYEVDGLIFTPKDGKYKSMRSWKWKPINHMSIDFLVKESPSSLNGIHPYEVKEGYTLLFLFSGISKELYDKLKLQTIPKYQEIFPGVKLYKYFPIQFSPSNEPYAYVYYHPNNSVFKINDIVDNVCEFRRINLDDVKENDTNANNKNYTWDIMRIRTDRKTELMRGNYFGNNFYIAEFTWQNYENPLTFDDLVINSSEYMDRGYFQEEKTEMYRSVTAYNSYVKGALLKPYQSSEWLVDLAAGKGQDLFRVSNAEIKNALFVDSDAHALSELVSRKHDFERGISRLNTRVFTKLIDLKTPYEKILKQIQNISVPIGGIDIVMCNFAIHYLLSTPDNLRNLINVISGLLKPGGYFFFTSFDGSAIFKTLKDNSWNIKEGEVLKYSINKKYTSKKLEPTGQLIDVMLPFSKGKYYEEYLVNYDYLIKEFKLKGFILERQGNFSEYMDDFSKDVKKHATKLSSDDKKFLSLYGFVVLKKKDKNGGRPNDVLNKAKAVIANNYSNIDAFNKAFKQEAKMSPIETLDDITQTLEYESNAQIIKPSTHIGQRKLFLSEMQFLTQHPKGICVYAGSSPSHKTHYLSLLFPDVKFVLIDPNKFDIVLPSGKSHRHEAHDDIVHVYSHFETKSNTYDEFKNRRMADLSDDEYTTVIDFIKQSNYKMYIIEDYMSVKDATAFKTFGDFTFISDIRSNSSDKGYPLDADVYWNMSMMYNWITVMSPTESMLKHRMPYGNDTDLTAINNPMYADDFKLSMQFGIDFVDDYKKSISRMSKAALYIQAWPGVSSTEMRMRITRDDITNIVKYDVHEIESKFAYYNNIQRPWFYHVNENSDKSLGLCHCGDCALENKIITDYVTAVDKTASVKGIVKHLGKVTSRPLPGVHKFMIWENLLKNPSKFQESVNYAKEIYFNERKKMGQKTKYTKHRGDKGKA